MRLIVSTKDDLDGAVRQMREVRLNGTLKWELTFKRHQMKRSLSQNGLLHKWFDLIAKETGNGPEDVKDAYKALYLGQVPVRLAGNEEIMVPKNTRALVTREFSHFMEQVYAHATQELGIILPIPEEATWRPR